MSDATRRLDGTRAYRYGVRENCATRGGAMEVELTGNVASDAGLGVRVRVNPRRLAQPVRDMLPVTPESYIYRSAMRNFNTSVDPHL